MTRTRLRLRVSLVSSDPEIWRLIDIDADRSLRDLHETLQIVMGWRESHLHKFTDADPYRARERYRSGAPEPREWGDDFLREEDDEVLDEHDARLGDIFADGDPLWYEYDFGDGWIHLIELIESDTMQAHEPPVVLVRGENRAPYEDSGGLGGYHEKLTVLADPNHPDHREVAWWVRATVGPWAPAGPDFFDPIGIQSELNLLFTPAASGVDPADMSGLISKDSRDTLRSESPLVDIVSRLPVPIRAELRQHLHRTGTLAPVEIDAEAATRAVAPFAWLLRTIGPSGLTLTGAGWMPPATVLEGMTILGWTETWIGKANREDITMPMRVLRETAQRMGLVRVPKRRLLLGAEAKKAFGDPVALWRLVASRATRKFNDAEADAATLYLLAIADGTPRTERYDAVAFGMEMLGWQSRNGWRLSDRDVAGLLDRIDGVLSSLGFRFHGRDANDMAETLRLFAREALR